MPRSPSATATCSTSSGTASTSPAGTSATTARTAPAGATCTWWPTWTWASWRYTDEQAPDRRSVAVVRADLPRGGAVVDVRLGGSDPVAAPGLARRRCADRAGVARPARGPAHGSAAPPATARRPGLALLPHMLAGGAFEGPAGRLPSAA